MSAQRITWRKLFVFYGLMVLLCAAGTLLAYKGPLSSEAWRGWSSPSAWKRDTMRAVVGALLSLFVIWNLDVIPPKALAPKRRAPTLRLKKSEVFLLLAILLALSCFNFLILPSSFRTELLARKSTVSLTFEQILKPYFPYFLYVICLWMGIVAPAFLFLLRRIHHDLGWWRRARVRLYEILSKQMTPEELTIPRFQELLTSFQDYVIGLKNIAERYLPVLLAMSLVLLHEQLTSAHQTVTSTAIEAAKAASWLFLGPALLIFISLVAMGYQSAVKKAEIGFSEYIESLVKYPDKGEVLSAFLVLRTNFIWEQSPLTFVVTAVKSASVSIPLLLAVTGYVLKSVIDQTAWPSIFLPNAVLDFLKTLYQ